MISLVETRLFARLVREYSSDDEYSALRQALAAGPGVGTVIPGSGGVRKSRMKSMARTVAKRDIGTEIREGLRRLKRGEVGRVISLPPVAKIRERTGRSQARFASLPGASVRTLQEWEQGRRAPSGAARTLLTVAARNPHALLDPGQCIAQRVARSSLRHQTLGWPRRAARRCTDRW